MGQEGLEVPDPYGALWVQQEQGGVRAPDAPAARAGLQHRCVLQVRLRPQLPLSADECGFQPTSPFPGRNLTRPAILKNTGTIINPIKFSKPSSDKGGSLSGAGGTEKKPESAGTAQGKRNRSAVQKPSGVKKIKF